MTRESNRLFANIAGGVITTFSYKLGDLWSEEGGIDCFGKIVPPPFPLRILTVDCQMDHLYVVIRSWSAEGSSRLIWCERILTFEDVEAMQKRFSINANLVFVDAGDATYEVYKQCAERGWVALMGDKRTTFVHKAKGGKQIQRFYSPRRRVVLGASRWCYVHYWSNLNIKDSLARLRRIQDPANGAKWEVPNDVPEEYLQQMESEHRVKDKGKWAWLQIGNRPNHYFDAECMQTAAATMLKLIGRESIEPEVDSIK